MTDLDAKPKISKIIVFAAQNLVKEALQVLLETMDDVRVVGSANECSSLPDLVKKNQPNLILLYLLEDDAKSVEKIPELQKSISEPYVLAITKASDLSNQTRALQLGAIRTLQVEKDPAELLETINQICSGRLSPDLRTASTQSLKNKLTTNERDAENSENFDQHNEVNIKTLTEREREIVGMVGDGLRNKEIAEKLNISKATVRHHLSSVYDKLELKDKLNLVIFAHRHKLVKSINYNI